jgi:ferredoxin-NADP reductase
MILKVRDQQEELSTLSMFHVLVALVVAPLIGVKILIARRYKSFQSALVPLGLTIFVLGFVLVFSTAGPYLFRRVTMKDISLRSINMGAARFDLRASEELMQKRCSRCHDLDRVVGARKDAQEWLVTVNRMRALPGSGISENDAKTILSYLLSEDSIDSSTSKGESAVGKALVDTHCNRCHGLDRTYQSMKSPDEWRTTVARMVRYARGTDGFFKPGEDERIVRFLSVTQTPDAVQKRRGGVEDTVATNAGPVPEVQPANSAGSPILPTTVVIAFITAVFGTLIVRRPRSSATVTSASTPPERAVSAAPLTVDNRKPIILELTRIERQTHDCVTLRMRLPTASRLLARPGQFLTFHWLLDGQKLVRSYSISSSPTQTGYLEITVKKQQSGSVSAFLNERAQIGLTVEAHGPAGRFYFDECEHRRVFLFAGGSGITPIISMLRYMDDRCCDIEAVLLYSVHTPKDIIFEAELDRLLARLPRFRYVVVPATPDENWKGPSGRVTRKVILDTFGTLNQSTFFLCGPGAYMDHVKGILASLNIAPERILQEHFGGKKALPDVPAAVESQHRTVEFARSNQICALPGGRTVLEVAEMNSIEIPYSCRHGQCGTCVTRLIEGAVTMDCEDGLDPALKGKGYILPCVARSDESIRIDA